MSFKKFSVFHLSLLPIEQLSFSTRDMTREEWLRNVFSKPFVVPYRADQELHWVPQLVEDDEKILIGVIQRQKAHSSHEPPEKGGGEIQSTEWQGAYVLIDPASHDEGQRIAVEHDIVGLPSALLKYIIDYVNTLDERPFNIEFDPVFDGNSFWEFSQRHDNVLGFVKFDFASPNMWSAKSDLERELQETKSQTGAERVKVEFRSRNGIRTDSQKVRDGVQYAERGAGDVTAMSMDGKSRFSSRRRQRKTDVPPPLEDSVDKAGYLSKLWRRILGREAEQESDADAEKTDAVDSSRRVRPLIGKD